MPIIYVTSLSRLDFFSESIEQLNIERCVKHVLAISASNSKPKGFSYQLEHFLKRVLKIK